MKSKIATGLLLAACYTPPGHRDLEQTSQTGLYFVELEKTDGSCSHLESGELEVENGIPFYGDISNCVLKKYEWDQQTCLSKTSFQCQNGLEYVELNWLLVSNEQDLNILDGILTIFRSRASGLYSCEATYSLTATK